MTTEAPFLLVYLWRELRRRMARVLLIAAGLATGVGLLVTESAATSGLARAQATALHALYGIGTDITVTVAPPPQSAGPLGASPRQGDVLSPGDLGPLPAADTAAISRLAGVAAAAGGLVLQDLQFGSGPLPSSRTVEGVDLAHLDLGPLAAGKIAAGRSLMAADGDADVAVLDDRYAAASGRAVGSHLVIAGTAFVVVGVVSQPARGAAPDVYIPLARAQALARSSGLADLSGAVNTMYVRAASAARITGVAEEIARLLPNAAVITSVSLATAVSGSLANAARLAADLGRWVAAAGLSAAFALASLLTAGSVAHRVREFGTLRALGWQTRSIVVLVLAESTVAGLAGVGMGIAAGCGGAALLDLAAPSVSAVPPHGGGAAAAVTVGMHALVSAHAILLGAALAMAGAWVAGALGSWRAARLGPAQALARIR